MERYAITVCGGRKRGKEFDGERACRRKHAGKKS